MDDVLTLIARTITQDENGVEHATETPRNVFCKVSSISQNEFFKAGRAGLNPAFRFSVFAGDFGGETLCEYRGERFAIYRTYKGNGVTAVGGGTKERQELSLDYVELYARRTGGTNGTA